ncbi:GNAT family N-acetyltransferase [Paenibacillus plantiphilus]|uniref:GNAT family N-acetyltransferase n=1 Tax=Paenibacillus plantiphilus TaxID=2905650 RepID=UPI001F385172|nr:GNAT family N-acetyltransferase [Paenibacillus plantiphilus]
MNRMRGINVIKELEVQQYAAIRPLLEGMGRNPVIEGVIDGNNRGRIFADHAQAPTAAFVWAKNEMFYLLGAGGEQSKGFNGQLEHFIIQTIKPLALADGEDYFNMEIPSYPCWQSTIDSYFRNQLNRGERVPFIFRRDQFQLRRLANTASLASGYELRAIDRIAIEMDTERTMTKEILKFWESIEQFMSMGIGYCVMKGHEVVGTCLSVFVSGDDYEIGINTYNTEHRGKGLATAMAMHFITACLHRGGVPHWTTESFRLDSIAIANKLGFEQLPNYPVYYHSFEELL